MTQTQSCCSTARWPKIAGDGIRANCETFWALVHPSQDSQRLHSVNRKPQPKPQPLSSLIPAPLAAGAEREIGSALGAALSKFRNAPW